MKLSSFVALAFVSMPITPTFANLDLATKNQCTACHAVDKNVVGPGFQEIAKKYKGSADAQGKLAESILKGGSGKWGAIPMPAQTTLSEADAKTLAAWILSTAK